MISSLVQWVATAALNWLAKVIAKSVQRYREQLELDRSRGQINEENVKKYEEALTRQERIDAALGLLNNR